MARNNAGDRTGAPLRVLVVDDNKDAADTLAMAVRHAGHKVQVAYNGIQAILFALKEQPHVILLDIGLPQIDGYTIVRELRNRSETRHAKIIAVTGHGLPADIERTKVAGFDAHLLKPVDHVQLCAMIDSFAHCNSWPPRENVFEAAY